MSKEIEQFIERLRDYKNFEVKVYECEKYHCEIADLLQCARSGNFTQECLKTWENIFNQQYFELKHPIYNHITTRAVANFLHPRFHINYILFTDKEEKFTWLTLQLHGIADCFITENTIYIEPFITQWGFHNATLGRIPQLLSIVSKEEIKGICFSDMPFQVCFDNIRPFHYFGDDLFWFFKLQIKKEFLKIRAFWLPNALKTTQTISKDFVYISPRLYPNDNFESIRTQVVGESLCDFNHLVESQDKLDRFDKEEIAESEIMELIPQLEA